jgi:hypothetical protein
MSAPTGVKTTVLQAWAAGIPCVAIREALAGLPAFPGENVIAADSLSELVDACLSLLDDPKRAACIAREARETVEGSEVAGAADHFGAICQSVAFHAAP